MSDYLDPNNQELLNDFFAEANSQVDALERNILVLENDPANSDAVDEIFRAAHTLKGGAATVEMTELAQFTHVVEDLLDAIRGGSVPVTELVVDALLSGIDIIKNMLQARAEGDVYDEPVDSERDRLQSFIPGASPVKSSKSKADTQRDTQRNIHHDVHLSEYEILEIAEAAEGNKTVYVVNVSFDETNVMNTVGPIHVFASLRETGTVLKTVPDFEKLYEDNFIPSVIYYMVTDQGEDAVYNAANIPDVVKAIGIDILDIASQGASLMKASVPTARVEPEQKAAVQVKPVAAEPEAPKVTDAENDGDDEAGGSTERVAEVRKTGQQSGSILRVDSRRIDNLLNQVSETVINKATFNQISAQFGELQANFQVTQTRLRETMKELFDEIPAMVQTEGSSARDIKKELSEKYGTLYSMFEPLESELKNNIAKFRSTAQNLGRITGELQEGVMRIRMVPINQIFSRFPRLIRDLSKNLEKKINLVIEGEETELDKSVIEDLLDPIMHSVRNAIDHGIESPLERKRAGKSEEGTILLKASNEGNMIVIEIADDGKGIDSEAIRQKAVDRGLIHPNKVLSEIESFNLIFDPGFSTASTITNISGRGVGLDVVKRKIEKLNGSVSVSSQKGKGTKFTIKLPLTLAIIQGLLVRVGKEIYSIPITSVIESHRIKPTDIRMLDNYEVFNVRNDVVSLLRLNRVFRIPTDEQGDYYFVVIVGSADKKMGLVVDTLIGEEDVVIKPLRDQFTNSPGIAGASILGDGSVCLIIDVSQLLELGQKKEMEERQRLEATIR